ncbi:TPR Domain containing protein [Tritrichomonas foetus]|uniref:TPR Domain containing protein n=1 Tax=Tritrichomonas foetus TaxID=1144522 RepID=A0A1J4L2D2_9EUKA|nr:TPR Domain containing protein [Tritrichomonas foetus]|eukprot:OHT17673.1 TPR Domain containing protein [Tritrichomonas foetus]
MEFPVSNATINSSFLDTINTEFELSFTIAASISKEMDAIEESQLAAKRAFSYNPNSRAVLDLFPQYAPLIEKISELVDKHGLALKTPPASENPDLWSILGYCYLVIGDFPNAFAAYAHAVRLMPDSSDSTFWYAMGIVYAHYKYSEHAVNCFQKVLDYDPKFQYSSDIYFRLALIQRVLGRYDNAIELLERIKNYPPNDLHPDDIQLQIAYTYQLKGNSPDHTLTLYYELHNKYPQSLELTQQYCWYFYLVYKSSDIKIVKQVINDALSTCPHDPTLLLIAALVAMKQDEMATAYQHYRYCISYCSDSPFFWCGLGVLYYKNEQKQDAVVAFQRALYLKSDMAEAWLNIGIIYEQNNEAKNALKIYQTGLQRCSKTEEFTKRINAINNGTSYSQSLTILDIDDTKFIQQIPEQFAADYISAVPKLPAKCFAIDNELASQFTQLNTYPKSLFAGL